MWLFAQFPQLYTNAVKGSADSISILFIVSWLSGDIFNLVGCILTNQLPFQVYLATYFIFIDSSLVLQVLYFRWNEKKIAISTSEENTPLLNQGAADTLGMYVFLVVSNFLAQDVPDGDFHFLDSVKEIDVHYNLGRVMAWCCAILYFTSRLPQIYVNFKRYSTDGLALVMFVCALMGNVFYVASILAKSTEPAYLYGALPYLIGSGGTIIFDLIIFMQFLTFPKRESTEIHN
jgi:uncharacterized protein with PQ loop repeat